MKEDQSSTQKGKLQEEQRGLPSFAFVANATQTALVAQMQAAADQIAKAKESVSATAEDLTVRLSADTKNAEVGIARFAKFAAAIGAAYDFGEGMAEVNKIVDSEDEEDK